MPTYPILQVAAINPDIRDARVNQNITHFLDKTERSSHFEFDQSGGSLRTIKDLDIDLPDGYTVWETFSYTRDSVIGGGSDSTISLENLAKLKIELDRKAANGIQKKFGLKAGSNGKYYLETKVQFNRAPLFQDQLGSMSGNPIGG